MVCPRLRSVFPLRRLTGLRAAHTVLAKNLPRSLSLPHGFTHGRVKPGKYHVLYTGFTGTGNPLTRDKLSQDLPSLSLQRKYTFSSKLARLVTRNSPESEHEHPLAGKFMFTFFLIIRVFQDDASVILETETCSYGLKTRLRGTS